jgi:hypothetical protein
MPPRLELNGLAGSAPTSARIDGVPEEPFGAAKIRLLVSNDQLKPIVPFEVIGLPDTRFQPAL